MPSPHASSSSQQSPDSGHQPQVHAGKGGHLGGVLCRGVSDAARGCGEGCRLLHYCGISVSLFCSGLAMMASLQGSSA